MPGARSHKRTRHRAARVTKRHRTRRWAQAVTILLALIMIAGAVAKASLGG